MCGKGLVRLDEDAVRRRSTQARDTSHACGLLSLERRAAKPERVVSGERRVENVGEIGMAGEVTAHGRVSRELFDPLGSPLGCHPDARGEFSEQEEQQTAEEPSRADGSGRCGHLDRRAATRLAGR